MKLFSGFIECGDCHDAMVVKKNVVKGKAYHYYICNSYKKDRSCKTHLISQKKVMKIVLTAIQKQVELVVQMEQLMKEIELLPIKKRKVVQLDAQMVSLQEETERYKKIKQKLYEDYVEDILSREEYLDYTDLYNKKISERQDAMKEVTKQRSAAIHENGESNFVKMFKKYQNLTELTRPVVAELIHKILIYEDGRVEIIFQFQDEMEDMAESLKEHLEAEKAVSEVVV